MDKHYDWQEGRGSQVPPGRARNGQRWNERNRDDDREMRGRGEYGWDDDSRSAGRGARFVSGADLDREDYTSEGPDDAFGNARPGQWGQRWHGDQGRWSQSEYGRTRDAGGQFGNRSFRNEPFRGQGPNQGFSGGHYGGFANEGYSGESGYGGRTWNQGSVGNEGRNFSSYGQTFGQGYGGAGANRGHRGQGTGRPTGQATVRGTGPRPEGVSAIGRAHQGAGVRPSDGRQRHRCHRDRRRREERRSDADRYRQHATRKAVRRGRGGTDARGARSPESSAHPAAGIVGRGVRSRCRPVRRRRRSRKAPEHESNHRGRGRPCGLPRPRRHPGRRSCPD